MYINVNNILAPYYDVIDIEKNERISGCQSANDITREYEVLVFNNEGDIELDDTGKEAKILAKIGNIKIIRHTSYINILIDLGKKYYDKIIQHYRTKYFTKRLRNNNPTPDQINILKILYNRKTQGIKEKDLHKILNTPELLDKELNLFKFKQNKEERKEIE